MNKIQLTLTCKHTFNKEKKTFSFRPTAFRWTFRMFFNIKNFLGPWDIGGKLWRTFQKWKNVILAKLSTVHNVGGTTTFESYVTISGKTFLVIKFYTFYSFKKQTAVDYYNVWFIKDIVCVQLKKKSIWHIWTWYRWYSKYVRSLFDRSYFYKMKVVVYFLRWGASPPRTPLGGASCERYTLWALNL